MVQFIVYAISGFVVLRVMPAFVPTPGHANICEGVMDVIFDLSVETRSGSVLAGQRSTPCWPVIVHGDVSLTVCLVVALEAETTKSALSKTVASMSWGFMQERISRRGMDREAFFYYFADYSACVV
jgi:hypothetical protein